MARFPAAASKAPSSPTSWTPTQEGDYVLRATFNGSFGAKRSSGTTYEGPLTLDFNVRVQTARTLTSPTTSQVSGEIGAGETSTLTITAQDDAGLAADGSAAASSDGQLPIARLRRVGDRHPHGLHE